MKTILLAWELGRGLGHIMNIRRIGARLKAHDARLVAAVGDRAARSALEGAVDDVVEAPPWRADGSPPFQRTATSSATLNDILSAAGLSDHLTVQRLLIAWDEIYARTRPDLVIADFSPMAALAARGRIPLVLVGNGYTLPPHEMLRFPLLHRSSPPAVREEQTLAAVNAAVQLLRRTWLDRLPQLFSGDACLVQTFPLLDPYDAQRTEPLDGPMLEGQATPRRTGADMIFAYLSGGYEPHPAIFEALKPFAGRLRVYAPRLSAAQTENLRSAGARIDIEPAPLAETLSAAGLFVHNGGTGAASEALMAGVPQLILGAQVEQDITGDALQRAGVAKFVRTYEPDAAISAGLIESMLGDPGLATRAATLATWHSDYMRTRNPLVKCENTCLALLGL